jgi:predicted RNA binding protein YcfA (HicA-like mRNA interferase family)
MSDSLAALRVVDVVRKLRKAGFEFDHPAQGSHEIWRHRQTHRRVVIPNHPGDVPKGTLRNIIHQPGLTVQEFIEL